MYIWHTATTVWDKALVVLFMCFNVISYFTWSVQDTIYYSGSKKEVKEPEPKASIINLNGKPMVYQQVTTAPKIDLDQQFCRMLVSMKRGGLDIDLTEDFWIKTGRYKGSAQSFRDMKYRLKDAGALKRKNLNNNAPFIADDWGVIERKARGQK